jgi:hypothetical protein
MDAGLRRDARRFDHRALACDMMRDGVSDTWGNAA